jgi:outer membrane protein assembly factor BamB
MKISDLVFIGIKGSVIALDGATGTQAWATHLPGGNFVNVVVDEGRVLASCDGEIFCLDAATGDAIWHNPLKGFGFGLASITTKRCPGNDRLPLIAEIQTEQQQSGAAAAV